MGKPKTNPLSVEFLYELYATALQSDSICGVLVQYMEKEFLPDRSFQRIQEVVANHYRNYKNPPTYAVLSQAFSTDYDAIELINTFQEYLDTGSHDNAYSYSDGVLVANLPAARWYFACILYAAVDPDEFNQLNHVLSGSIEDIDAIENEEVRDCIYTLYNAGILTGSDAYGTFHPDDGITRAEVAAIMARIIDPAQRKTFTPQEKPVNTGLANYVGKWYFNDWPDCGLGIEKIGNDYYLSLTIVQGKGYRFNGTLEPVKLINKGTYYESVRFDTMRATTAVARIRPEGNQLVVSCTEYGTSSLPLNMSGKYCSRR